MKTKGRAVLSLRRHFNASRELVFRAWTDPAIYSRWGAPAGFTVAAFENDLRVDGNYRLHMTKPDGEEHTVTGRYTEIDPPRRLAMTWRWEHGKQGDMALVIELNTDGTGTELVLTQSGLLDETDVENHRGGWESTLDRLGRVGLEALRR